MSVAYYSVPDISCEGCANAIKRAVSTIDGIHSVDVDVDHKKVCVEYDSGAVTPDAIRDRIGDAGYDTTDMTTE